MLPSLHGIQHPRIAFSPFRREYWSLVCQGVMWCEWSSSICQYEIFLCVLCMSKIERCPSSFCSMVNWMCSYSDVYAHVTPTLSLWEQYHMYHEQYSIAARAVLWNCTLSAHSVFMFSLWRSGSFLLARAPHMHSHTQKLTITSFWRMRYRGDVNCREKKTCFLQRRGRLPGI